MIICAGFSGGAIDGLETGDVVIGNRAFAVQSPPDARTPDGARSLETEQSALGRIMDANAACADYAVAPCLTASAFASDPAMKRLLGSAFGAAAIDMESYWAMEEASKFGVPCVPVRVILDPVGQRVSRLASDTLGDTPARRAFRAARYIAAHPKEAPELLRLWRQTRMASGALGDFLTRYARAPATQKRRRAVE